MRLLQAIPERRKEEERGERDCRGGQRSEAGEVCVQPNVIVLLDSQWLKKLKYSHDMCGEHVYVMETGEGIGMSTEITMGETQKPHTWIRVLQTE